MPSQLEVFVDEESGVENVGLVLRETSIVEYEDELVPGCLLTPVMARKLALGLLEMAWRIDGRCDIASASQLDIT